MRSWQVRLGVVLFFLSFLTYLVYHVAFNQDYYMVMYMLGDLAFVFINVLLVTIILQSLLERREKEALISKMSTVIGAYFSEIGRPLMLILTKNGTRVPEYGLGLHISGEWTDKDYEDIVQRINGKETGLRLEPAELAEVKQLLTEKRSFLLGLMENGNLLEHERFTEMLLALFHVQEELMNRKDVMVLPASDIAHLNKDVNRAFTLIIREWIMHMRHLQKHYPYLFSLAVRTNPFDPQSDSVVKT
jgi:hypothetical protein